MVQECTAGRGMPKKFAGGEWFGKERPECVENFTREM